MDTQTNCAKIQRPYFYSLDTFRGIAALFVVYACANIWNLLGQGVVLRGFFLHS